MSIGDSAINRFLFAIYPYMHMKLYDAVCRREELRDNISDLISDLIDNQEAAQRKLKAEADRTDSVSAQALRILVSLSEKGNKHILTQIRDGMRACTRKIIDKPVNAIVFQVVESGRWITRYGANSTYDLVVVLPRWAKVISISTSEVDIPMDPMIPRFAEVRLENLHLYSFFNRAHAVRGRRISEAQRDQSVSEIPGRLKPFMRTCKDIQTIGNGLQLAFFTPISTIEGLRLGFFFTLMCRVTSVELIRSSTGFGVTLGQSSLTLSDSTGTLRARMNTEIFLESMANPMTTERYELKNPEDMLNIGGKFFVVGVWLLGRNYPEIAFLGLPKDESALSTWGVWAFMNSHRKAQLTQVSRLFNNESINNACRRSACILRSGAWLYYKEELWPEEIFLAFEKNGFPWALAFTEAMRFGANYAAFSEGKKQILQFLRLNPHILNLYRSKRPLATFEEMHKLSEIEEEIMAKTIFEIPVRTWPVDLVQFSSRNRKKIFSVSQSLSSLGYTVQDLFSPMWNNGGAPLERRWWHARKWSYRLRGKRREKAVMDEMTSAIIFILSMRGEANLPREALV